MGVLTTGVDKKLVRINFTVLGPSILFVPKPEFTRINESFTGQEAKPRPDSSSLGLAPCGTCVRSKVMADGSAATRETRISAVVRAVLARRSVQFPVASLQDLSEAGLTSLDLVNLMLAIEAEFDIEIPPADVVPDNFRSIAAIDRLVANLAPKA